MDRNLDIDTNLPEILAGCVEGKSGSWEIFFQKFHKLITGVLYKKSLANPEDNIQIVYLRLVDSDYKLLRNFRGTNYGAFILYLKEICFHVANDENKKILRRPTIDFGNQEWQHELVDSKPSEIEDDDKERLLSKLMGIELIYREVLILRSRGYKTKEISEILQIPVNTVLTRIKRGIDKLKKSISSEKNTKNGNKIQNRGHQ